MKRTSNLEISLQDFKFIEKIGTGGFATVYKAYDLYNQCSSSPYVAIKKISRKAVQDRKLENRVREEIRIHKSLRHSSIAKFYASFCDQNYYYLVLEYCSKGSLEDYMKIKKRLPEHEAYDIMSQLVAGLIYLKCKFIIHRDISLRNILLSEKMEVKIADFGMATKLSMPDETKTTMVGTPNYMPPEIVVSEPQSFPCDCWSLGCVLFALLGGKLPFNRNGVAETLNQIVMSKVNFPADMSYEAKLLLESMLHKDSSRRVDINVITQSKFFEKYANPKSKCGRSVDSGKGSMGTSSLSSRSTPKSYDSGLDSLNLALKDMRMGKDNLRLETIQSADFSHHSSRERYSRFENEFEDRYRLSRRSNSQETRQQESQRKSHTGSDLPQSLSRLKSKIKPLPSRRDNCFSEPAIGSYPVERSVSQERRRCDAAANRCHSQRLPSQDECTYQYGDVKSRCASEDCNSVNRICSSHRELEENNYQCCSQSRIGNHCDAFKVEKCRDPLCRFNHARQRDTHPNAPYNEFHSLNSHKQRSPSPGHRGPPRELLSGQGPIKNGKRPRQLESPLKTVRIPKTRKQIKNIAVTISENGQVIVEHILPKGNELRVSQVCIIDPDGIGITCFRPHPSPPLGNKPPPFPKDQQGEGAVQQYIHSNLPPKHWNEYNIAKRFINIQRARTAKITLYGRNRKCYLRENGDFEVDFCDGTKITMSSKVISVQEQDGKTFSFSENESLPDSYDSMWDQFKRLKEKCKSIETCLESVEISCETEEACFPAIIGRTPSADILQRSLKYSNKENTPQSFHSNLTSKYINLRSQEVLYS